MQSRYRKEDAPQGLLPLRCYTSRLLGAEPSLVLHGGGNTSVKGTTKDFFGEPVEVCWVKGSGWDLASIEPPGFPAVKLSVLRRMAEMEQLSDVDMVREQRAALLDPGAPDPSIEAILHAILPHAFVDHTHADAVITLTNAPGGLERIRAVYGERALYVPYVMPGFVLARAVRKAIAGADWTKVEGIVLLQHGLFTFGEDARESYERTIRMVTEAEEALAEAGATGAPKKAEPLAIDPLALATVRKHVSRVAGKAMVVAADTGAEARGFASRKDVASIATRGPLTPDHVIRTKRVPVVIEGDPSGAMDAFAAEYGAYFSRHAGEGHVRLDPAPRWAVLKDVGVVAFGQGMKLAKQTADIARHTVRAIQWAEALGGWSPLHEKDLFDMEYWELEQRKLRKPGAAPLLAGKVALVSGGATGIGRATAELFRKEGAAVCVLDLKSEVQERFRGDDALGLVCDVTDTEQVNAAVARCLRTFGGLDVLVPNAGDFPPSKKIADLDDETFEKTHALNLGAHLKLLRAAAPFLSLGVDPAVVFVASRNVPAPGPGAAAYSTAKAALTQLMRVAALELAEHGVRVSAIHPDKVFDTELWSDEKIALRAQSYGISVDAYKRQNLLKTEVTTKDCAEAILALVRMKATTGAQVPVDGGSDRVI
jgi:rhamnose utilization protein RhaD (predicted bifunctional aldolase and dehydrogenase)/NAD(P)-dependent dehydrogenase (short-subunit alcohol dehydrogenase family)